MALRPQWPIIIMFAAAGTSGCKVGSPTSAGKSDTTTSATSPGPVLIHGSEVAYDEAKEIYLAMGATPPQSGPLSSGSQVQIALQGGDPYIDRCRAAGVPIPPAWGDPGWKKVKELSVGRIFALDASLTTTLYSYQDPAIRGTCAALPRMNGSTIVALGIICQSTAGEACFWDNKERTVLGSGASRRQATISDPARIRPDLIANGDNLVENCSSCHRGTNVFILHHEDLQQLPASDSDKPFTPIANQPDWKNVLLDGTNVPKCAGCHDNTMRLGRLDIEYCSTVMMPSIQSAMWNGGQKIDIHDGKGAPMPPPGETSADYVADVAFIKAGCKQAYAAAKQAWAWDP